MLFRNEDGKRVGLDLRLRGEGYLDIQIQDLSLLVPNYGDDYCAIELRDLLDECIASTNNIDKDGLRPLSALLYLYSKRLDEIIHATDTNTEP